MAMPSLANPGKPVAAIAKRASIKKTMALKEPPTQSMTFVNNYVRSHDENLLHVKNRSNIPFTIIDSVLSRFGLPHELKYLAVIESELKTSAVSRVGAKGAWQLMPGTARVLGLKVNHKADERRDYAKSTVAAAKYLRDLHHLFNDWLLVLAAYNGGPRPVYKAIQKSKSRDFWVLQKYLPAESRLHVKKFIATTWYFEGQAKPEPEVTISRTIAIAQPIPATESTNEKFNRLMKESAQSLKASNELLEVAN